MRGSVKKSGASWYVVLDNGNDPATGKRRQQKKRGFTTKRAAESWLADRLRDAQAGQLNEPSREPCALFLESWLDAARVTVRESTWHGYDWRIRKLVIPRIGAVELRAIDAGTLNALYGSLLAHGNRKGGPLSARSVSHVHKVLHRAFRDAVRWGKLRTNPAEYADPPQPRRRELQVWTAEQVRAFLEGVEDDRLRACWHLALASGLRRGELAALRWSDLDGATLTVARSRVVVGYDVVEREPKSGRTRAVALDPATVEALRSHRVRQLEERLAWGGAWTDSGYVFTREDGTPMHPMSLSEAFERAVGRTELPRLSLHGCRHTHATLGLAAGVSPRIMQERLGHSSVAITLDLYTHPGGDQHADAAASIGALIGSRDQTVTTH
jgi:integrase